MFRVKLRQNQFSVNHDFLEWSAPQIRSHDFWHFINLVLYKFLCMYVCVQVIKSYFSLFSGSTEGGGVR